MNTASGREVLTSIKEAEAAQLLSINDAAEQGIERLRQPNWSHPLDHVKIDIVDSTPGLWVHVFSPYNEDINGRDPVDILCIAYPIDYAAKGFLPYTGPLPDSDEYRAARGLYRVPA